jgi:hypothetical protein
VGFPTLGQSWFPLLLKLLLSKNDENKLEPPNQKVSKQRKLAIGTK